MEFKDIDYVKKMNAILQQTELNFKLNMTKKIKVKNYLKEYKKKILEYARTIDS